MRSLRGRNRVSGVVLENKIFYTRFIFHHLCFKKLEPWTDWRFGVSGELKLCLWWIVSKKFHQDVFPGQVLIDWDFSLWRPFSNCCEWNQYSSLRWLLLFAGVALSALAPMSIFRTAGWTYLLEISKGIRDKTKKIGTGHVFWEMYKRQLN